MIRISGETINFIVKSADILGKALQAVACIPVNAEKPIEVLIRPYKKKRSLEANAYYHVVIKDIAKHIGYSPEETKAITKFALGFCHTIQGREDTLVIYDETSKFSIEEMGDIVTQTVQWGIEKGVEYSQPDYNVEFGL